jgi:glyoxylate reductase
MNKRIFITRKIPAIAQEMLEARGYIVDTYQDDSVISPRKLLKTLEKGSYDAVLSLLTDKIDARVFDAAPGLKIVANYATGFDNIDIAEAKKRGITVTNAPADLASGSVAEHTIAMLLALSTRIVEADSFVRAGKYEGWAPMNFVGTDVWGKTIGLVGIGRIGERVAVLARAMGVRVMYTDVFRNTRIEDECGAEYVSSIDELLPRVDFVSLHVPLLDSTHHLINKQRLGLMKSSAFIINTSRGAVIDEEALEEALQSGSIAGAALDVFEFEPKVSSGLKRLKNVILTPHIASASIEARSQMAEIAAQNIIDCLEGGNPRYAVNPS